MYNREEDDCPDKPTHFLGWEFSVVMCSSFLWDQFSQRRPEAVSLPRSAGSGLAG